MHSSATPVSAMKAALVMLLILDAAVEAAPTMRGSDKPPHPDPGLTYPPALPEKSAALNPSQYLKRWLLSTKAAAPDARITDRTTAGTVTATAGVRPGRVRGKSGSGGSDKPAQVLRVMSALEELQRAFDSTQSSRIAVTPRGNGRNSGRKSKVPPADDGGVKPTTSPPAAVDSSAPRASAGVVIPSLTGRTFRKSLPPQTRKTNKRVCFWKYCSQN